jgi:hypothetical protein
MYRPLDPVDIIQRVGDQRSIDVRRKSKTETRTEREGHMKEKTLTFQMEVEGGRHERSGQTGWPFPRPCVLE